MNNTQVLIAFLNKQKAHTPTRTITNGIYQYKGQTMTTDGTTLINYSTRLAYWDNDTLYLNTEKYSSTTSHLQSKLKRLAAERSIKIVEYQNV